MKNLFTKKAHRYEKRLKLPVVSIFIENRDRHIRNFLSEGKGSLLDLGAGTGYYLNGFAKNFSSITAVDSSAEMLEIFSKNNSGAKIKTAREDAIKFSTAKKFDNVLCIGLLNYLPNKDMEKIIGKIFKLTKKGGRLLITAPSSERLSGRANKILWAARGVRINLYSEKFLRENLEKAGFKNIEVKNAKDFLTFHIILEAAK